MSPTNVSTEPESTWPATLAGGEMSRRSSMRPISHMTTAAVTTPSTFPGVVNTSSSAPKNHAEPRPASTPMSSAVPPRMGVASACTLRSLGYAIASARRESTRRGTTARAVAAAEMIITAM
ncbi:MAG: hypothetical protein M5U19_19925 [Microthrixaceae bacterium]|nr:hypothetical protein [Microthrixaceae bacterium]